MLFLNLLIRVELRYLVKPSAILCSDLILFNFILPSQTSSPIL